MKIKSNIKLILIIPILLIATYGFGQASKAKVKKANKLFNKEFYRDAVPLFEEICTSEPSNNEFKYKKAVCYLNSYRKVEALKLLKEVENDAPTASRHLQFWLGRADHLDYEFEDAIVHFQIYEKTLRNKDSRRQDVELYIQQCRNAMEFQKDPKNFLMQNLGDVVNTIYSEHSPLISNDGNTLIFTSRRVNTTGHKEAPDGDYFEDIFVSEKKDGEWQKPYSIGNYLNTTGHEASIQLIDNETKLLMYKFTKGGDFYISEKQNGKWTPPYRLDDINTGDFESDAHVTADGNTMYFSSDDWSRDGNLDLFFSIKGSDGKWGAKKRIDELDTGSDEDSPFLSKDGKTLYFSSRGFNSMGGYDIFKSDWDEGAKKWGKPVNMGMPINSPDNDIYYYQEMDGKTAYLSSFRLDSYGEKDLYRIIPIPHVNLQARILDEITKRPVPGVVVTFEHLQDTSKGTVSLNESKEDSSYTTNVLSSRSYRVVVMLDTNELANEKMDIPLADKEGTTVYKEFFVKVPVPVIDTSNGGDSSGTQPGTEIFTFKDINFEFDRSNLTAESIKRLNNIIKIMKAYPDPELRISVNGHTDSKGTNAYNIKLSKRRAKVAYEYLVRNGVDDSRLEMRHFGEDQPIAKNESNGKDSETGRAKNRRTEFKLIEKKK